MRTRKPNLCKFHIPYFASDCSTIFLPVTGPSIFVNPPPLPLLCEISGALAGRQADEIQVKFSKLAVGRNIQLVASFNQGTASLQPYQCIQAGFFG